jgi:hypothetical protein
VRPQATGDGALWRVGAIVIIIDAHKMTRFNVRLGIEGLDAEWYCSSLPGEGSERTCATGVLAPGSAGRGAVEAAEVGPLSIRIGGVLRGRRMLRYA